MKITALMTACLFAAMAFGACCKNDHGPQGGCICPAIYDPVCGSDGKVYDNYCRAQCAGVDTVACP